jgi:hypothetical protein
MAPDKIAKSAEEKAADRSIVWLREGALDDDVEAVKTLQETIFPIKLAVYDSFNGSFALDMSAEQARAQIEEAAVADKDRILKVIDHIEPDSVIYAFQIPRAGCIVSPGLPAASDPPENITRVGGPICTAAGCPAPTNKVWLVDTGVDKDYDDRQLFLDNQNAADCSGKTCLKGLVNADDTDGHGTAIAGIIAGRVHDGQGLQGVAPGATIVPVKIMSSSTPADEFMTNALRGLEYVKKKRQQNVAKAGDVVSISWGTPAHFSGYQMAVEDVVRDLADRDMKVVIAAGNLEPFTDAAMECNPGAAHAPGGGLVGTMVPARAGSYSTGGSGGVWTVSAVATSAVGSDAPFWFYQPAERCPDPDGGGPEIGRTRSPYGSFFGNDVTFGTAPARDAPPDFAEPGVSIPTLWINDQAAVCTGTSFSVPHLAGILLHSSNPDEGGRSVSDPGAFTGGAHDRNKEDPIGVCKTGHPGCTYP